MKIKLKKYCLITLRAVAWLTVCVMLLPALLYIPYVQEFVKNYAVAMASETTGWKISLDRILLKFPVTVSLQNLVVEEAPRDTMLAATVLDVNVRLLPLLDKKVSIDYAELHNGKYHLLSEDKSLNMMVRVNHCNIDEANVDLSANLVDARKAMLEGGYMTLDYDSEKSVEKKDSAKSEPWRVIANDIILRHVHYEMTLMPYIDRLKADIAYAHLADGIVDTNTQIVDARYLKIDSARCTYFTPSAEYLKAHPAQVDTVTDESPSMPWTVTGDSVRLTNSHAIYAMRGAKPCKGLDLNYLEASEINIAVDSFYNRGAEIRVPIRDLRGRERCGIRLAATDGIFSMDSIMMAAGKMQIATEKSSISGDVAIYNTFFTDPNRGRITANVDANIELAEIAMLYPEYAAMIKSIPSRRLGAKVEAGGSMRDVKVDKLDVLMPGFAWMKAKGRVSDPLDMKRIDCDLALRGEVGEMNFMKPMMITDTAMQNMINIPPLKLNGNVAANNGRFVGAATLALESGDVVFDAMWNGRANAYAINFDAQSLPITAILPRSRLKLLTAHGDIEGKGFDFFKKSTSIKAEVNIDSIIYNSQKYKAIMLNGQLADGKFNANFASHNPSCDFAFTAKGVLERDHYVFSLDADIDDLNLYALNASTVASNGTCRVEVFGDIDMHRGAYLGTVDVSDLRWTYDQNYYYTDMLELDVESDSSRFFAQVVNDDLNMELSADCCLDTLTKRLMRCSDLIASQMEKKSINIDTLRNVLPPFTCDVEVGTHNLLQQALENSSIKYKGVDCRIANDSTIYVRGRVNALDMAGVAMDTIRFVAFERNRRIDYFVHVGNREGTMPRVAQANLRGALFGNTFQGLFTQTDFDGLQGFKIGLNAELTDSTVSVGLFPDKPIIGYKEWELNDSNMVAFNYHTKHFDADLALRHKTSEVSLHTKHDDGGAHGDEEKQEDIILNIKDVQIADWLALSPFAPPMKGVIGSNWKIKYDGKNIWGDGIVTLNDLTYEKRRVGNVELNTLIDVDPSTGGTVATGNCEINGRQCIVVYGALNDSVSAEPLLLELELDKLPLATINPFLPRNMAELSGNLNGLMKVTGTMAKPVVDGYIQCDSTRFNMPAYGASVRLPNDKLPVDSGVIKFNQFTIKSLNENPIIVDGTIDARDIYNPYLDLSLLGHNVEFVNARQTGRSELFGRGFIDIDTSIEGTMNDLSVDADVALLEGSYLTYIMQSSVNDMAKRQEQNMVKFVQFTDSSTYVLADSAKKASTENSINLNASLKIQSGTKLSVFISKNGKDRAEINGSGDFLYSMNRLGDVSLVGQYNIESGFVGYSPPLISRKLFHFNSGSYVRWTGSVSNPRLNISAYELHKTNVTQENADSRIVDFIIRMNITNNVSDMKVVFDLDTNDDITIQNELAGMSESQRATQAINLLLYNTYTGTDTKASGNLSGNPLFSFMTSQINKWAASALKGISVSVGMNQYDTTLNGVSSKTVEYSYQVSKSLFDDRFKVVVGGNYDPTTTSGEDIAKNLFNDVSLEYMLNKGGNMYVRIFNHTGYLNVLEGKVTQTGVAFVYKRKIHNLKYLFDFNLFRKKEKGMKPADENKEKNDTTTTTTY